MTDGNYCQADDQAEQQTVPTRIDRQIVRPAEYDSRDYRTQEAERGNDPKCMCHWGATPLRDAPSPSMHYM